MDTNQNNLKPIEDNNEVKKEEVKVEEPKVEMPQKKEEFANSTPQQTISNVGQINAQTIGTIKPDKQKSPITMLVLFGLLVVFILFMPNILDLVNTYFGTNFKTSDNTGAIQPIVEETKDEEVTQNNTMYNLTSDTVIEIDKIQFGGFIKNNTKDYELSFYVKNTGAVLYSFEKKVYFEYYDQNDTFVGRSYLENVKDITGGITNNYTISITEDIYNKASKVEIVQRTNDDYPAVTLNSNQLICENSTDNIIYTFDSGLKLTSIRDVYTYTKANDALTYNNDLVSNKTRISSLDSIDGVTAVLTETDTGFITSVVIDYSTADYSKLSSNNNYYVKDTYAKVISFEMNSKGYICR